MLVITNNSSISCRVQFCSWILATNFRLKMTSAAWRFIPYSRHTHIWLRLLSLKDVLPITDSFCRSKNSRLQGLQPRGKKRSPAPAIMYVGQHLLHAEDWGEEYHLFPARYTGNPVALTGRSVGLPAILYHSPCFSGRIISFRRWRWC